MAILTDFMERKLLDHIFGVTEMTKLSSLYLGISTTAFSESDTASQALAKEPGSSGTTYNGNGYSRVNVYGNFEDTTDGATNGSQISFPQVSTSNWGNIGYWALFEDALPSNGTSSSTIDADDGQKPLMIGSFSAAVTTNVGDQFRIATGDFDITLPSAIQITSNNNFSNTKFHLTNLMGLNGSNVGWTFWDGSAVNKSFYLGVSTSAFGTSGSNNEDSAGEQEPGFGGSAGSALSNYNQNGYSYRPTIAFNSASTSSGTTTITNSSAVEFPEASANWGDITHFAVFAGGDVDANAITHQRYAKYPAGNSVQLGVSSGYAAIEQRRPFFIGALDATKTINNGDTLRFPAGSISIALD
jgi:hypothetical protein